MEERRDVFKYNARKGFEGGSKGTYWYIYYTARQNWMFNHKHQGSGQDAANFITTPNIGKLYSNVGVGRSKALCSVIQKSK